MEERGSGSCARKCSARGAPLFPGHSAVVSGLFKCYVSTIFWGLSQSFSAVNVPSGCAWMQVE